MFKWSKWQSCCRRWPDWCNLVVSGRAFTIQQAFKIHVVFWFKCKQSLVYFKVLWAGTCKHKTHCGLISTLTWIEAKLNVKKLRFEQWCSQEFWSGAASHLLFVRLFHLSHARCWELTAKKKLLQVVLHCLEPQENYELNIFFFSCFLIRLWTKTFTSFYNSNRLSQDIVQDFLDSPFNGIFS